MYTNADTVALHSFVPSGTLHPLCIALVYQGHAYTSFELTKGMRLAVVLRNEWNCLRIICSMMPAPSRPDRGCLLRKNSSTSTACKTSKTSKYQGTHKTKNQVQHLVQPVKQEIPMNPYNKNRIQSKIRHSFKS